MSRRVYISCDFSERELEEVVWLCDFLNASDCIAEFVPDSPDAFYRGIEEAIERADAFVAIVGVSYDCSTWLNFELHYADSLRRARMTSRPQLFGLRIGDWNLPRCSEQIELEWLDASNRHLLLTDLPQRA